MENIVSHFNFEESISIGVQRADVAATNKAEISEIFNEFSQAFQNASSGRVHSAIKSKQRKIYEKNHSMLAMAGMFNSNYNYENYKALVLSNNKKEFTIAEIIENEVVENKRLGSVLAHIQQQHEELDKQNNEPYRVCRRLFYLS